MRYLLIVLCIIPILGQLFVDVEKGRYVTGSQSSQRCTITTIQTLLKKFVSLQLAIEEDSERALRVVMAVSSVEVAGADDDIKEEEREVLRRVIENYCVVTPELARELADTTERQAREVTSLQPFTRLIAGECSLQDRIRIVRMLWEVSGADGCLDEHEEHLTRKVADLLYVPDQQFIFTRLQENGCQQVKQNGVA